MRFKAISEEEMTPAQLAVYEEICAGPRGKRGPPGVRSTDILTRCPELGLHAQKVGEYLRFRSTLPQRVMELAILTAAREWSAGFEWHAHYPIAVKAGLSQSAIDDIGHGRVPQGLKEDEVAAYRFSVEIHRDRQVSDETFQAAWKHFGETGVVDLMGAAGYYTLISLVLKVNQTPVPEDSPYKLPELG